MEDVKIKPFFDPFNDPEAENPTPLIGDLLRFDDTNHGIELYERERMNNSRGGCEIHGYRHARNGHRMPLYHSHNCYEFIFVMSSGKFVFSNTGGTIESDGKCVCFHNSHVLHRNNVPLDVYYDRFLVYCGESATSMIGGGMGSLGRLEREGTVVIQFDEAMLKRMEYYLSELSAEGVSADKKCLLMSLIFTELKEYSNSSNTRTLSPIRTYIKDVAEYIGTNYKHDITTPELAQRFFVSVNKLNRDFKRYTGTTIKQYLIALRMKYAQAMLAGGEGVKKTAEECGFDSLSYFIQAFRQYTGQTPSAFAKKALGKFDYYT